MKFYQQIVLPWLLEKAMSKKDYQKKREAALKSASGKILEIGLGTGLNIPAYPKNVREIFTVDINPGMNRYAEKRARDRKIKIHSYLISAERLPFGDETFDTVVSTWTMCSIESLDLALTEIYRVLKRGGKLIFLEHGLSSKSKAAKWQKRLTPIWKKFSGGCHLDRNIKDFVQHHFFKLTEYKEFEMPNMTKLASHMYQGVAVKRQEV